MGTANQNLPGFIVLGSGEIPLGGINVYGSGFLPAVHQGSFLYPERPEPLRISRPRAAPPSSSVNSPSSPRDREYAAAAANVQVEAAIQNYETAYRMQTAVPNQSTSAANPMPQKALRHGLP